MIGDFPKLIFLNLLISSLIAGDCPRERINELRTCEWRFVCIANVINVRLPDECRGDNNYNVSVDLTIHDALENYDEHADEEFLKSVTSFQAVAIWPETSLPSLKHMSKLKKLILSNNKISCIAGSPFSKLKDLQHLDLSGNSLSEIGDLFQFDNETNKLTTLLLRNNAIENIPNHTFSQLTSLKELDLSYNQIADLTDEPFNNLKDLKVLRLNNNRIRDLNGALNSLANILKHLYLRGNQIENIDEPSLNVIYHLQTFDASSNQLEKLKPVFFMRHWAHFNGDCKILLSGNRLTSIPNGSLKEIAGRFTRDSHKEIKHDNHDNVHRVDILTEVDLSNNSITTVEYRAFQNVMKMTNLDLSRNFLKAFHVSPEDLRDVRSLNLSFNYMKNLYYESFAYIPNLQNLDLSNNALKVIPDDTFANTYNIRSFNMTHNEINILNSLHIKMFHEVSGILDLSGNGLSRFVIPDRDTIRLNLLALNHNEIADTREVYLKRTLDLKRLEMRNNSISKLNITSLRLPLYLRDLDLRENFISEIGPSTFNSVPYLKSLHLGHNNLTQIEYGAFQGLADLSSLDLSFNMLSNLDSKVFMDLKSLTVLSLRSNGLFNLDYKAWLGLKHDITVYLDDNQFSCNWLGTALREHNNGYSKMWPKVLLPKIPKPQNSLDGIPCTVEAGELVDKTSGNNIVDERLLVINQHILEAVNQQNHLLTHFMRQFNVNMDTIRY